MLKSSKVLKISCNFENSYNFHDAYIQIVDKEMNDCVRYVQTCGCGIENSTRRRGAVKKEHRFPPDLQIFSN
jgi:hypothetical protein